MKATEVESLAQATLAHGFIQAAVHFPPLLVELGLSREELLQKALVLAEQAIALAPTRPDGYTALARLLLCHPGAEANQDALAALRHALSLDPDHDPAEIALATALWRCGDLAAATDAVDRVLKRGNPLPQPLVLSGLIKMEMGRVDEARGDFERAVKLAPEAGLFRLDAAAAAAAAKDPTAATAHRQAAKELLGTTYEATKTAWEE